MRTASDQAFVDFAAQWRPRLVACAWLLHADAERAERLVDLAMARLYGGWPRQADPALAVFQLLLTTPAGAVVPWRREARVQLTDGPAEAPLPAGLVRDLAELPADQREALVLQRVSGLRPDQVASLLEQPADAIDRSAGAAALTLAERDPRRLDAGFSTAQLADAVHTRSAAGAQPVGDPVADLEHGRMLVGQRRTRRTLAVAAVAVVLVLAGWWLRPATEQVSSSSSPADPAVSAPATPLFGAPTPPGRALTCDPDQAGCRVVTLREWRADMAEVIEDHLDPQGTYFTGTSYAYTDTYETPGIWTGQPGALAFDMFRVESGATQVFLQMSTNRRAGLECGATIGRPCGSIRFQDGNRFAMTDTTDVAHGMEVQHCPQGQCITVVARNVSTGRSLDIERGDLLLLVQDKRLQLPAF